MFLYIIPIQPQCRPKRIVRTILHRPFLCCPLPCRSLKSNALREFHVSNSQYLSFGYIAGVHPVVDHIQSYMYICISMYLNIYIYIYTHPCFNQHSSEPGCLMNPRYTHSEIIRFFTGMAGNPYRVGPCVDATLGALPLGRNVPPEVNKVLQPPQNHRLLSLCKLRLF